MLWLCPGGVCHIDSRLGLVHRLGHSLSIFHRSSERLLQKYVFDACLEDRVQGSTMIRIWRGNKDDIELLLLEHLLSGAVCLALCFVSYKAECKAYRSTE